jgi:hypothetical protein
MARLKGFALLTEKHSAEGGQKVSRRGLAHTDQVLKLARIIERECTSSH